VKNRRLKNNHSYRQFWLLLTLLLLMVFVRYGLQINIPRVMLLIPVAAIALQGSQTEIVALIMCLIPLHESLDFYYALLISAAVYVVKYSKRIRVNLSVVLILIMIAWELLHCFFEEFSPIAFVTSLVPLVVLAIIMCSDLAEVDYDFLIRSMSVTLLAVAGTMFVQIVWLARFNLVAALANLRRLGSMDEKSANRLEVSGGMVQMNSLGILSVLAISGILQLRNAGRRKKIDLFLTAILLIFGALSASRTFLVCLVLMILLMLFSQRNGRKKLRFLAMVILACFLFLLVFGSLFPEQLEYYGDRFLEADITTGRDDLMVIYHRFITNNPKIMFFGVGVQDYRRRLINEYHVTSTVPHNSIQEIVVAWGLPGFMLCLMLLVMMIRISRSHTRRQILLNYIPLIIILFKSMAGQLLTSGYSMLALSYAYLSLCQNFRPKEER